PEGAHRVQTEIGAAIEARPAFLRRELCPAGEHQTVTAGADGDRRPEEDILKVEGPGARRSRAKIERIERELMRRVLVAGYDEHQVLRAEPPLAVSIGRRADDGGPLRGTLRHFEHGHGGPRTIGGRDDNEIA